MVFDFNEQFLPVLIPGIFPVHESYAEVPPPLRDPCSRFHASTSAASMALMPFSRRSSAKTPSPGIIFPLKVPS